MLDETPITIGAVSLASDIGTEPCVKSFFDMSDLQPYNEPLSSKGKIETGFKVGIIARKTNFDRAI